MKKLFILSILIFLGIFGSHAETNIVKSNKVKTGIYKYSNDINIEYVILEDIDEAIIYSYREQEEVDDRLNTKDTSATLENALTEFTKLNLNKFSKYKNYYNYKMLKRQLHYNVIVNDTKYVIFEARILFLN